ncbi:unnamed protein product [Adineta steineri]|uniref:Uncharacterized protein n=1 Tax=Adineta steineri TaxID=433720 RepID=A0A816CIN8_9BILA|nr:unnamed protein product [Adineta steineri]CAF1622436.1 unnamed protein product [Adineta steineri]
MRLQIVFIVIAFAVLFEHQCLADKDKSTKKKGKGKDETDGWNWRDNYLDENEDAYHHDKPSHHHDKHKDSYDDKSDYKDGKSDHKDGKSDYKDGKSSHKDGKSDYDDDKSRHSGEKSDYKDGKSSHKDGKSSYDDDKSRHSGERTNYKGGKSSHKDGKSDYDDDKSRHSGEKSDYKGGKSSHKDDKTDYDHDKSRHSGERTNYKGGKSNYKGSKSSYNDDDDNSYERRPSYNDDDDYQSSNYNQKNKKPDDLGHMNIYFREPSKDGKRRKPKRFRFPVARYERERFPKSFGPLISFLPWLPIFADRLTKQTIIYSPTGGVYIIPPVINFYGRMTSVAELISSGYASLVSSGAPPPPAVNVAPLVQPGPVVGPGVPAVNPVAGGFTGGVKTDFRTFEKEKHPKSVEGNHRYHNKDNYDKPRGGY